MLPDALADYQAALPILDEHHQLADAARARAGLAPVLMRLGRLDEADHMLADAASEFASLGQSTAQGRLNLVRSELAFERGRHEEANSLAARALEILRDRPLDAAAARYRLAALALDRNDLESACASLDEAMPVVEEAGVTPLLADLLHLRGLILRRRGDMKDAVATLREAVSHLERIRGSLQAERFRAAFIGDRLKVYESLVRAILDSGTRGAAHEALEAAELAKSRARSDLVRGAVAARADNQSPESAALRAERDRLLEYLNHWYARLGSTQPDQAWRERAHALESDLSAVEARLAATQSISSGVDAPLAAAEVQQGLAADETLIEYFVVEDDLLAFVVKRDAITVHDCLIRANDLHDLVRRMKFQFGRAMRSGAFDDGRGERLEADARRALGELYQAVMRPLESVLPRSDRLTVIPHGPLHHVPFAALHDGRQHLIERYAIVTAPSASMYARLAARKSRGETDYKALVVGVADERVPMARREVAEVATMLHPVKLLLDHDATAESVAAAMKDASIVHFACHGRFDSQNPLGSGLRLYDRWFTVRDAYRLKLHDALLVLSACETGLSAVTLGDELDGLLRGFLAAGARGALMTLWMVDDATAAAVMRRFYENFMADKEKDTAKSLREAQRNVLRTNPHPIFWAPYILVSHS